MNTSTGSFCCMTHLNLYFVCNILNKRELERPFHPVNAVPLPFGKQHAKFNGLCENMQIRTEAGQSLRYSCRKKNS